MDALCWESIQNTSKKKESIHSLLACLCQHFDVNACVCHNVALNQNEDVQTQPPPLQPRPCPHGPMPLPHTPAGHIWLLIWSAPFAPPVPSTQTLGVLALPAVPCPGLCHVGGGGGQDNQTQAQKHV